MQRIANLVDLEKCCKMSIWTQKLASIQKRTSPLKVAHLAEKSENCSISNPSTKVLLAAGANKNAAQKGGATPIYAAAQEGHAAIVAALLAAGAEFRRGTIGDGATPLFVAAQRGHEAVVSVLLRSGTDKIVGYHEAAVSALLPAGGRGQESGGA